MSEEVEVQVPTPSQLEVARTKTWKDVRTKDQERIYLVVLKEALDALHNHPNKKRILRTIHVGKCDGPTIGTVRRLAIGEEGVYLSDEGTGTRTFSGVQRYDEYPDETIKAVKKMQIDYCQLNDIHSSLNNW